jgi:hypothetical protein
VTPGRPGAAVAALPGAAVRSDRRARPCRKPHDDAGRRNTFVGVVRFQHVITRLPVTAQRASATAPDRGDLAQRASAPAPDWPDMVQRASASVSDRRDVAPHGLSGWTILV